MLTVKAPERPHRRSSGVFIANFEDISHCSTVYIVNFQHVIIDCEDNSKIWKHKGRWVIYIIDVDKNLQKLGLLGFLLFHVQGGGRQVLLNPWKTRVNKISALQPAHATKSKVSRKLFWRILLAF